MAVQAYTSQEDGFFSSVPGAINVSSLKLDRPAITSNTCGCLYHHVKLYLEVVERFIQQQLSLRWFTRYHLVRS